MNIVTHIETQQQCYCEADTFHGTMLNVPSGVFETNGVIKIGWDLGSNFIIYMRDQQLKNKGY